MREKERFPDSVTEGHILSYGTEEEGQGLLVLFCGKDNLNLVLEMLSWERLGVKIR